MLFRNQLILNIIWRTFLNRTYLECRCTSYQPAAPSPMHCVRAALTQTKTQSRRTHDLSQPTHSITFIFYIKIKHFR